MSWPLQTLGELVDIRTGKLDANASVEGGSYPFFTCSRITLAINTPAFDADAILIAGNGDLNVKHYKGKFNAYQRTYVVTVANQEKLDSRYLFFFMDKYVERLRELSIGGVIKYIKLGMLTEASIPLPPLTEQKRIAAILDKADAIRSKRQQAIQLADEFLRAVFLDMFGDPVTNPKGWHSTLIGDLISIKNGFAFKSEYFCKGGEYILLTPGNFYERGGYRDREDKQKYYTGPVPKGFILSPGDILIAMTEQAEGLLGSAMKAPDGRACLHNQRLGLLNFDEATIEPNFLLYLFNSQSIRKRIHASATGLKVRHTSPAKISEIEIGVPPISMQKRFSNIVRSTEKSTPKARSAGSNAENLFSSLMQKAFSGQL